MDLTCVAVKTELNQESGKPYSVFEFIGKDRADKMIKLEKAKKKSDAPFKGDTVYMTITLQGKDRDQAFTVGSSYDAGTIADELNS